MLNRALIILFRFGSRMLLASGLANVTIGGMRIRTRIAKVLLPLVTRNISNPVEIDGFKFYHGGSVSNSVYSYISTEYEPATLRLFRSILKPGDVVYDAGSHIGYFSVVAASIVGPSGHVYSFEASSETAGYLHQTVEANGFTDTITVVEKAIADRVGALNFSSAESGSTARKIIDDGDRDATGDAVDATTLDAHWEATGRRAVRLLKIDVEGYELKSLMHGARMLAASPDCVIVFETRTHSPEMREQHAAIMSVLTEAGFSRAYALHDSQPAEELLAGNLPATERFSYLNIAVSKQSLPHQVEPKRPIIVAGRTVQAYRDVM